MVLIQEILDREQEGLQTQVIARLSSKDKGKFSALAVRLNKTKEIIDTSSSLFMPLGSRQNGTKLLKM